MWEVVVGLLMVFFFGVSFGTKNMTVKVWSVIIAVFCGLIVVLAAIVTALSTLAIPKGNLVKVAVLLGTLAAGYLVGKATSRVF